MVEVVCLVCDRTSNTGQHYGVTACLGCKTFFRRVVLKGSQLKCKFANKCKLEKGVHQKRLCRSCRYEKCKDIGMRAEALHPSRDLIGRRTGHSTSESTSESLSPASQSSNHSSLRLTCAEEDALDWLRALCAVDHNIRSNTHQLLGFDGRISSIRLNCSLTDSIRVEMEMAEEWVRHLPGFASFSQQLQKHMCRWFSIKYCILEHGLVTASVDHPDQQMWLLTDGTCLHADASNEHKGAGESSRLLSVLARQLIDDVAAPLRRLRPQPEEIAALKMLMLLGRDVPMASVEERAQMDVARNRGLLALHAFYTQGGVEEAESRMGDILMLSGQLAIASIHGMENLTMLQFFHTAQFDATLSEKLFS